MMNITEKNNFVEDFSINRDDIMEDDKNDIKKSYLNGRSSNIDGVK